MAEQGFETFRVKQLEDAGLRKIPKHLMSYYYHRENRFLTSWGFQVDKPTTVIHLAEQCYRTQFRDFQPGVHRYYQVRCEENANSFGLIFTIC